MLLPGMPTPTLTVQNTSTFTTTGTPSFTGTFTPTFTATQTFTRTVFVTDSVTPTMTETITGTPPTQTSTPSVTPTITFSPTTTMTATQTVTLTLQPTKTFTPTFTYTLTLIPTITKTEAPSATPPASPTITATTGAENIKIIVYPNPIMAGKDPLNLFITAPQKPDSVKLQIYTAAFRLIHEAVWDSSGITGNYSVTESADKFANLGSGTYYYVVFVTEAQNKVIEGKISALIIIR
jgi:hypothetical protein